MEEIIQKKYMIMNITDKNFELFDSTRSMSKYMASNNINISHTTIHRRLSTSGNIIIDPYIIIKLSLT
mgnify:CR=1 FL=1